MTTARFNGSDYDQERDAPRLSHQLMRVWTLMLDRQWRTLEQIASSTGDPTPSVSAQLRHLRKARFGSHIVEKDRMPQGHYRYRLKASSKVAPVKAYTQ